MTHEVVGRVIPSKASKTTRILARLRQMRPVWVVNPHFFAWHEVHATSQESGTLRGDWGGCEAVRSRRCWMIRLLTGWDRVCVMECLTKRILNELL